MGSSSHSGGVTRSGGKMTKRRRRPMTPYDRPPAPPQPQPRSPNWLTGLISTAASGILVGATMIASLVFDSDSSDNSSSSSSSDGDDANDDNDYDELDNLCGPEKIDNEVASPLDIAKAYMRSRPPWASPFAEHTELQTSSPLPNEISRDRTLFPVGDKCLSPFKKQTSLSFGSWNIGEEIRRVRLKATEDLLRSPLKCGPEKIDNEVASPLDVAKAYMRSRPPWASPFAEHTELQTSSTLPNEISRDGTLFPAGDKGLSSFKKQTSLSFGSWNLEEEIRRVRLKATEDLLRSPLKCGPEKDHGAQSEAMQCIRKVHQLNTKKSRTIHTIEKLLMQESYSREECDRLTQMINSRVVDSTIGVKEASVATGPPDGEYKGQEEQGNES